jgi:hypothetical protein
LTAVPAAGRTARGFGYDAGAEVQNSASMKRLCRAASLPDAHILRGVLEQSGIEAHVFNENAQSGVGQLPVTEALPEVWVADERDLARAQQVIREFESAPRVTASAACSRCGEDNPANFQVCWNCGAALC